MKTGIIGLPGSGKSTLFDLITESSDRADAAHQGNKPRVRFARVHDVRLERLRDDYQPKKYTPAQLEVLDFPPVKREVGDRGGLADLLAPAREMEALVIVLRDFVNPGVAGGETVDPVGDLRQVLSELVLSDLVIVERRMDRLAEKSRKPAFTDEERKEQVLLEQLKARLEKEERGVPAEWSHEDQKRLSSFGFLSAKPYLTVLSTEGGSGHEERLRALRGVAGGEVIGVAARDELEILELPEADRAAFLKEYGIDEFLRDRLIQSIYRTAGQISFFTVGDKEVRAWTLRAGETAIHAAGTVHTDMERGFIRAEVVNHSDYVKYGGMKGTKESGHYRLEGREYVVKDGDIVLFRFSV